MSIEGSWLVYDTVDCAPGMEEASEIYIAPEHVVTAHRYKCSSCGEEHIYVRFVNNSAMGFKCSFEAFDSERELLLLSGVHS